MKYIVTAFFVALTTIGAFDVPSLTTDNYVEMTAGKTVLLKFFTTWCPHCQALKDDWEKLAQDWGDSQVGLVAEIDCDGDGKPLCDANAISMLPTIKYGDPNELQEYHPQELTYNELSSFAHENLKPLCLPTRLEFCSDEEKALVESYMAMTMDELDAKISELESIANEAIGTFDAEVFKLQQTFEQLDAEREARFKSILDSGLTTLGMVRNLAESDASEEAEVTSGTITHPDDEGVSNETEEDDLKSETCSSCEVL